jgi:hypothetical protein
MKMFRFIPLLLLTACATAPRLTLRPQPALADTADSAVRYPEAVHAYHVGRYADPDDDLVMHERHVVYRVEENPRWDLQSGRTAAGDGAAVSAATPAAPRDAAFSPAPVNDAILAEVNSQRLATAQIMVQARTLSAALAQFQSALQQSQTNLQQTAALRATMGEMKQRLAALEAAPRRPPPAAAATTTNEPADSVGP